MYMHNMYMHMHMHMYMHMYMHMHMYNMYMYVASQRRRKPEGRVAAGLLAIHHNYGGRCQPRQPPSPGRVLHE